MKCPCPDCRKHLCCKCNGHLSSEDHYQGKTVCETCIAAVLVDHMEANTTYYDITGKKVSGDEYRRSIS